MTINDMCESSQLGFGVMASATISIGFRMDPSPFRGLQVWGELISDGPLDSIKPFFTIAGTPFV